MRILIHDYLAYPFIVELARELARRGHEVRLLHGGGVRPSRGETANGGANGLDIVPVGLHEPLRTRAGVGRLLQERRYGRALARNVEGFRADVVLSVPSSLDGQAAALAAARRASSAFVYWLQDIYSEAIARLLGRRLRVAARLAAWRFASLEGRLLREADAIITISEDFRPYLEAWRVRGDRIHVQPNWAPLREVTPGARDNAWARDHGVVGRHTFVYSGTLGRKHDPSLLTAVAEALPDAMVVVVAEGTGVERLRDARRSNLKVLPLQPASALESVLAAGDVLVALLGADAGVFSVPSKVLTYLTAGRPILAAIPLDNQAAATIREAGAGLVVDPTDRAGFVEAARALFADPGDAGAAGRAYAERHFAIDPIADCFEAVLERAIQAAHSQRP